MTSRGFDNYATRTLANSSLTWELRLMERNMLRQVPSLKFLMQFLMQFPWGKPTSDQKYPWYEVMGP
jgi:hypothetical protein